MSEARILVVDDEPNNVDVLTRRLQRAGYDTAFAENGQAALDALAADSFDAVLLDYMMPGMDGMEVLQQIRADSALDDMPVLMVTAKNDAGSETGALQLGADDFVSKPVDFQILNTRLTAHLDRVSVHKDLAQLNDNLNIEVERRSAQLKGIVENLPVVVWQADCAPGEPLTINMVSGAVETLFGAGGDAAEHVQRAIPADQLALWCDELVQTGRLDTELTVSSEQERNLHVTARKSKTCNTAHGVMLDVSERKALEAQLLQTQKLESVGQLAAGIAHEINSPAQFTRDNISFLKDGFDDLMRLFEAQNDALASAVDAPLDAERQNAIAALEREVDAPFLLEEIPVALSQSLEGIDRISKIVKAMKGFSHPGGEEAESCDLNRLIEDATIVARNEWKYVADLTLELADEAPLVSCFPSEMSQVIVNLVVNAAHALAEKPQEGGALGRITVTTVFDEARNRAEIRIKDTGPGIPEDVLNKVFDPFFTTKEVGKGTGQGLAIARSVAVDRHGGDLTVESTGPEGTTFLIVIPIRAEGQDV